jgi:hypothetical protein
MGAERCAIDNTFIPWFYEEASQYDLRGAYLLQRFGEFDAGLRRRELAALSSCPAKGLRSFERSVALLSAFHCSRFRLLRRPESSLLTWAGVRPSVSAISKGRNPKSLKIPICCLSDGVCSSLPRRSSAMITRRSLFVDLRSSLSM